MLRRNPSPWEEGDVAPQVVFEILSPQNRDELPEKYSFYQMHEQGALREIPVMMNWLSPRLKIRFEWAAGRLTIFGPNGFPFETFVEVSRRIARMKREIERVEEEMTPK